MKTDPLVLRKVDPAVARANSLKTEERLCMEVRSTLIKQGRGFPSVKQSLISLPHPLGQKK